ncbi:MAG TPA: 2-phospho-L-lactate transferase [Chloroflexia bacterium]|nr:2-phospho-L-lactate transferase [Chloroflexia bacterium]
MRTSSSYQLPATSVVALAGGVGGAKLAHGLQMALPAGALTVLVNTADDFRLWGLYISPDLDTVMYTLAGVANPETGWGVAGDTWQAMEMLGRYGRDAWFRLGDRDLATHILRTQLLAEGRTLSEATRDLATSLGVENSILPMCDQAVQTLVQTPDGTLDFQDYFVRRRHSDRVTGITFRGIEEATPGAETISALDSASVIIFCPSNPYVSIAPILAVPGMRDAIARSGAIKVAVSPIVGGTALKGPASDMMSALGHEVSPVGVAGMYKGLVDGIIIDELDRELAPRIEAMGMAVSTTNTIMKSDGDRVELARHALGFCESLARRTEVAR